MYLRVVLTAVFLLFFCKVNFLVFFLSVPIYMRLGVSVHIYTLWTIPTLNNLLIFSMQQKRLRPFQCNVLQNGTPRSNARACYITLYTFDTLGQTHKIQHIMDLYMHCPLRCMFCVTPIFVEFLVAIKGRGLYCGTVSVYIVQKWRKVSMEMEN